MFCGYGFYRATLACSEFMRASSASRPNCSYSSLVARSDLLGNTPALLHTPHLNFHCAAHLASVIGSM
jgi:hypothetical protein